MSPSLVVGELVGVHVLSSRRGGGGGAAHISSAFAPRLQAIRASFALFVCLHYAARAQGKQCGRRKGVGTHQARPRSSWC
jgi:hypothetical protein